MMRTRRSAPEDLAPGAATSAGYEDLPRAALARCADDISVIGREAALARHLGGADGPMAAYVRDPRRAAFLTLLDPPPPGSVAIDVGAGFGALTGPLARRYGRVIAVEPDAARLAFARAWWESEGLADIAYVEGGFGALAVEPASCALVVFNGSFEWLPLEALDRDPLAVQQAALAKARDALAPGGRLYLAIENRFALYALAGHAEPHTGIRFQSVVPRAVADWLARRPRPQAPPPAPQVACHPRYLTRTYSLGGYRRLLRDAGFRDVRVLVPWPSYNRPELFAGDDATLAAAYGSDSLHRRLSRIGRVLPFLPWWLAPGFAILATR